MENEVAQKFLKDFGVLLKEKALDAKSTKDCSGGPYEIGALMSYHEMISLMQSQARTFEIPLEEIGLAGIDPEIDLL